MEPNFTSKPHTCMTCGKEVSGFNAYLLHDFKDNQEKYFCENCYFNYVRSHEGNKTIQVKTSKETFSLTEIPYEALKRVGEIFIEGQKVYGRGNWRYAVNNKEFQLERANHALKHLLIYIHELETGEYLGETKYIASENDPLAHIPHREDDLAKVIWFCMIMCELERLSTLNTHNLENKENEEF